MLDKSRSLSDGFVIAFNAQVGKERAVAIQATAECSIGSVPKSWLDSFLDKVMAAADRQAWKQEIVQLEAQIASLLRQIRTAEHELERCEKQREEKKAALEARLSEARDQSAVLSRRSELEYDGSGRLWEDQSPDTSRGDRNRIAAELQAIAAEDQRSEGEYNASAANFKAMIKRYRDDIDTSEKEIERRRSLIRAGEEQAVS